MVHKPVSAIWNTSSTHRTDLLCMPRNDPGSMGQCCIKGFLKKALFCVDWKWGISFFCISWVEKSCCEACLILELYRPRLIDFLTLLNREANLELFWFPVNASEGGSGGNPRNYPFCSSSRKALHGKRLLMAFRFFNCFKVQWKWQRLENGLVYTHAPYMVSKQIIIYSRQPEMAVDFI